MRIRLVFIRVVVCIAVVFGLTADKVYCIDENGSKLDSLDVDISSLINQKKFDRASELMLEKGKLLFDYGMYINAVTVLDNAISLIERGRKKDDTGNISLTHVECLNYKGIAYIYMSNYDKALECYIEIEKYNKGRNPVYMMKAYNGMGGVFGMRANRALSEEYYRKAFAIAKSIEGYDMFPICFNMGGMFLAKMELDSALNYLLDAHKMAVVEKNTNREIASLQSLGMVHFNLKKYNLSMKYYNEACDIAMREKNYAQLSFLKYNMINNCIVQGDYDLAFEIANDALKLSRQTGSKSLESKSLIMLSQIYEARGDYKTSLSYLREGLVIDDSLFNRESEDKLLRQKSDFDLYRVQSEKALSENNMALESAQRQIHNMVVWFVVAILIVILYVIARRLVKLYKINKRLSMEIESIQINDETRLMELEEKIEVKSRELNSTSLLLLKFNELSCLLNGKLRILKMNLAKRSKDMEIVKDMETLLAQFTAEKNWEQIKLSSEDISQDFYDKLDILYPDMTMGEKKICALISLNISAKEIASLTGKSIGAIDNAKFRIRKKMGVGADVNLVDVFCQMKG